MHWVLTRITSSHIFFCSYFSLVLKNVSMSTNYKTFYLTRKTSLSTMRPCNNILSSTVIITAILAPFSSASSSSSSPELPLLLTPRQSSCSQTAGPNPSNPSRWWRSEIAHNGTTPYSSDPTYQYYRTVIQFGADPSGVKDSSQAFNSAITCNYS